MTIDWIVFGVGTLGGLLAELLKWFKLRESPNQPEYAKNKLYWAVTLLMSLAGGVLAVLYGLDTSKLLLALNVGISAPLIIGGLAAATPPQPSTGGVGAAKDLGAPDPSVRNFLAGR